MSLEVTSCGLMRLVTIPYMTLRDSKASTFVLASPRLASPRLDYNNSTYLMFDAMLWTELFGQYYKGWEVSEMFGKVCAHGRGALHLRLLLSVLLLPVLLEVVYCAL